jgi:hypothetical protein
MRLISRNIAPANTASTTPISHCSRAISASIPARNRALASSSSKNCEKKFARAFTSASIRSIISPGGCSAWNFESSRRQCSARSARRALVARHATVSPAYATPIDTSCCATAAPK